MTIIAQPLPLAPDLENQESKGYVRIKSKSRGGLERLPMTRLELRGKANRFRRLMPVRWEIVSPQAFLRLVADEPDAIHESRFLPSKLGDGTFGAGSVTYRKPRKLFGRPVE